MGDGGWGMGDAWDSGVGLWKGLSAGFRTAGEPGNLLLKSLG